MGSNDADMDNVADWAGLFEGALGRRPWRTPGFRLSKAAVFHNWKPFRANCFVYAVCSLPKLSVGTMTRNSTEVLCSYQFKIAFSGVLSSFFRRLNLISLEELVVPAFKKIDNLLTGQITENYLFLIAPAGFVGIWTCIMLYSRSWASATCMNFCKRSYDCSSGVGEYSSEASKYSLKTKWVLFTCFRWWIPTVLVVCGVEENLFYIQSHKSCSES